ncbi:MAG: hypothetical protein ACLVAW_07645 [Eisenbergiella massiliensis]
MGERLKTWKKKLTKENMAIMALLGILLMVIAIPVKKTETQKDQTAAPENKSTASGTQETEEEGNPGGYAGELEERLESLLASMEGVGNVKVMVTLDSSGTGGGKRYSLTMDAKGDGQHGRKGM